MRERMEQALRTSKADYTEIRIEQREASKIIFRGRDLETADVVIDVGGIVRSLCRDGGWGIATFNSLDDLPARVEQAYQCAKAVHGETIELADASVSEERIAVTLVKDFRGVSLKAKKELVESYNEILLSYGTPIQDTSARYADRFSRVFYANSEGTFIEEERPEVSVALSAVARQGDNVQRGFEGLALVQGFEGVEGQEELAHKAGQRALDLLHAETVIGGRYPVILDQRLAGVFIHEAFGHLSEADFVYANPQAQAMMVLGRRFGGDILTVVDDGWVPGLRGTHKFDDEGTPTGRTELIKNGILVGRLHSRETAARMGELPTGNARATGYRHPPIVRMTNTFIDGGQTPFEEMIRDIELGVYACGMFGGQTMLENFSFSSAYAYMIRNGQIAEMVKDVVLSGNLFVTLQSIDAIGDDFQWERLPGGCGKGQGGLPVSTGAPHVRIQDVLISGR
ncbi:MAG: TldD/PmbA family protein [Chloroflexota bacterium]|nr:TldD/PmbA family protein [Chloroflexota bacterium]